MRRLQEGSEVPGLDDPVWTYPVSIGLVWMDIDSRHATVGLTSSGRGYATG